jgi:hypothetical protein
MTYEDFILSMVFYTFSVRDNKRMLSQNKGYRGLAANASTAKSAYEENWNYSLEDEEEQSEDLTNVQLSSLDIQRMFRPIEIPDRSELKKRFMTVDMATTGFDNLVMKYWELYSFYGFICKDVEYSVKNSNRDAVMMMIKFRDKHNLQESDMVIDVQGFGFLRDCFPHAQLFSGAGQASQRSKNQYKAKKDESAHIAMEMIQSGLIHYEPRLANMRYFHQHMKRDGATTLLKHMEFESRIFQFGKTPNGRIVFLDKEKQHTILKGMSPDLFDNVIMLCGATCYDCYRMLRDEAGVMRKTMQASDMLQFLSVNKEEIDTRIQRVHKIKNVSDKVLNILSSI